MIMIYKYKPSWVHINWKSDNEFLEKLKDFPEPYYASTDIIDWEFMILLSFEKQKWFYEKWKDEIKEPNINFCEFVKNYNLCNTNILKNLTLKLKWI